MFGLHDKNTIISIGNIEKYINNGWNSLSVPLLAEEEFQYYSIPSAA